MMLTYKCPLCGKEHVVVLGVEGLPCIETRQAKMKTAKSKEVFNAHSRVI